MARLVRTQVEFEGRVREVLSVVEEGEPPAWTSQARLTVVGQPLARVDGPARLTGKAEYTFDVSPPGLLHARFLRCPYPHARLRRLDTARATALPGVRAVLSHLNAPRLQLNVGHYLFDEELYYQGDEVAAVAADSEELAEDALQLIAVDYEELPFVVDIGESDQRPPPGHRPAPAPRRAA